MDLKKLVTILIASVGGVITFLILIVPIIVIILIIAAISIVSINNSNATEIADSDTISYSISGTAFPVVGCSYANINNTNYPSYEGHTGIDINIGVSGKSVCAIDDGEVFISMAKKENGLYVSYGEYVVIKHTDNNGNVYYSLYAHMVADSRTVEAGDTVVQGQILGLVDSTGNSTGDHLHFEIRDSSYNPINPINWLITE